MYLHYWLKHKLNVVQVIIHILIMNSNLLYLKIKTVEKLIGLRIFTKSFNV